MNQTERETYERWIANARIVEEDKDKVAAALARAIRNRPRLEAVARRLDLPWTLLAALVERESGGSLNAHPANGDSLKHRTRNDPPNLPKHVEPPYTYENCAQEEYAEIVRPPDGEWTFADLCHAAEHWNGLGPRYKGIPTSFVVASTTYEKTGKYIRDHVWDAAVDDTQVGCLALWLAMRDAGIQVP